MQPLCACSMKSRFGTVDWDAIGRKKNTKLYKGMYMYMSMNLAVG